MAFSTKLNLSNEKFEQQSGSTFNFEGDNVFGGDVRYDYIPSLSADTQVVHKKYVDDLVQSFSGESVIYNGASPSTIVVGGIAAGTQLTGRTANDILEEMLVVYLQPAFSSFSVSGQATTVEAGTELSGSKTFTWATSNSGNVQANSIVIRDMSASTDLATGLANDGSQLVAIATKTLTNAGDTQQWRAQGTNTQAGAFNSSNFTVTARYYRFYGAAAARPTDSATVRALPDSAFQSSNGMTFTLNTGAVETKFYVALPPGRTISSVVDLDALNAVITGNYVLVGTVTVNDNGGAGTARSYNLYEMTLGAAYSENHRHSITTA